MKTVIIGAGGYGRNYVKELLECRNSDVRLEGIVEPYIESCCMKEEIQNAGIPVYDTVESFYDCHEADLAMIATPTYLHCPQSIYALEHGSHVLCEKPLAPTVEEAQKMLAAEKKYNRFIAIGYQWSYSKAIQALKRDILEGVLGKPLTLKTMISWPRKHAYFQRGTGWGGRISKDGVMVLDSIAANACAHYLHNMFFLLGDTMETSAYWDSYEAECYRANPIENFDTCSCRIRIGENTKLYYIASHAADKLQNPIFEYVFENAVVRFSDTDSIIRAEFRDGSKKCYGDPFDTVFGKIWDCMNAVRNGATPICTVETAMPHNAFIYDLYKTVPIWNIPSEQVRSTPENDGLYAEGLYEKIWRAYEEEKLLSEV